MEMIGKELDILLIPFPLLGHWVASKYISLLIISWATLTILWNMRKNLPHWSSNLLDIQWYQCKTLKTIWSLITARWKVVQRLHALDISRQFIANLMVNWWWWTKPYGTYLSYDFKKKVLKLTTKSTVVMQIRLYKLVYLRISWSCHTVVNLETTRTTDWYKCTYTLLYGGAA